MVQNNNNLKYQKELRENIHYTWKTCWVKSIIVTKSIHCQRKAAPKPPSSIDTPHPLYGLPLFLQEHLKPGPSIIFQKA